MLKKAILFIVVLFSSISSAAARNDSAQVKQAWEFFSKGNFTGAEKIADEILKNPNNRNEALHIKANVLFLRGKYKEAIKIYNGISKDYIGYGKVSKLAGEAYLHAGEMEQAYLIFAGIDSSKAKSVFLRKEKQFKNRTEKTSIVPFLTTAPYAAYMPAVSGKINNKETLLRFDTGGSFLIIGTEDASNFNIELKHSYEGQAGFSKTKVWFGICDSLKIGEEITLLNVPVEIVESLKGFQIFGTNILEQFLCTVDYPGQRFIFTPRARTELFKSHFDMLKGNAEEMPFYLYSDHYMFAHGGFNELDSLLFFIDTGLLIVNPAGIQAGFNASKESLLNFGYNDEELEKNKFLDKSNTISLGILRQENVLVYYNPKLEKDRVFGEIQTAGLLSHAFLSKYKWTIDFNANKYYFHLDK
ncbi:MAG: aspartyl protease family protein [Bacteroidetes bacterium]|nr:aspartyl protease family protein [Bacteroidota bacterium]